MNHLKPSRNIFAICILAGFGIISFANDGALTAQDKKAERRTPASSPSANQILEWLPADTETFIVANGPFRLHLQDDDFPPENIPLGSLLESLTYSPWAVRKGVLIKELTRQQPLLAIEGARHFRPPSGLGGSIYEGCHVLVFQRDLGAAGDAMKKALASAGAKALKIAGREVFTLDEKFENDVWKFYFAHPQPNVLLCSTDQDYLLEMFRRMDRRAAKRALPMELPEWKHVDTTSRFWGIRHYGKDIEEAPGMGLVFNYSHAERREDKSAPSVKLLWPNTNIRDAKKAWTYAGEAIWRPKVQQVAPGVIEITGQLKRDGDATRFFFMLLSHLGHAIAV